MDYSAWTRIIKHRENLLPFDWRVKPVKLVDGLTSFEKVDKALDRHTSTTEAWGATHAVRTYPNCFIQPELLVGGHILKLSHGRAARNCRQTAAALVLPPRQRILIGQG